MSLSLDHFHDLGEADARIRMRAASALAKAVVKGESSKASLGLLTENARYAIPRLVRGCASSEKYCRAGFALALAQVLRAVRDQINFASFWELVA